MSDVTLSANAQKIMDLVEALTILELADLVSAMETKFGVSAAAAVVSGGNGGGASAEADEKTTVNVVITSAGAAKIAVIKVIREITGLGLAEAKGLADNGGNIKENVERAEGEKIAKQLTDAGATVEVK